LQDTHEKGRSAPQIGLPIVHVDPPGAAVIRGANQAQVVTVPAESRFIALILNFTPLPARATLQVDVTDARGQRRWVGSTEVARATATLNLMLPARAYPSGGYVIRISDITAGTRPLVEYPVGIRYSQSARER
jgi:hypothetical protein